MTAIQASTDGVHRSRDVLDSNFAAGKQTFIIPLTFPDITEAGDIITRVGYGGDIWELRVDLLTHYAQVGETNLPSPDYVEQQIKALQSMSDLPILYTIRTKSQGGKFPDDAADEALSLMLLAVSYNIQYIDVEVEWPKSLLTAITAKKSSSEIVASFHDWTGNIRWTSQELQGRFKQAAGFGDIIKLSIFAATIDDCHELALFVRDYRKTGAKPLLAVGMGTNGQLSRITSPISLVTHPMIPFPSAPGQLSLAQVNQALHLMGQLPKQQFHIFSSQSTAKAQALNAAFQELGYPHFCTGHTEIEGIERLVASPNFGGAGFGDAERLKVGSLGKIMEWKGPLENIDTVVVQTNDAGDRSLTGHDVRSGTKGFPQSTSLEEVCQWFSIWTGRRAPRTVIADSLQGQN